MDDNDSDRALNDLGARLHKAREAHEAPARKAALRAETSGFGQAFRIGIEMISSLLVGTGIGWYLDVWLGTRPWFLIIFIFLGAAAAMFSVYRTAMSMGPKAPNGKPNEMDDGKDKEPK